MKSPEIAEVHKGEFYLMDKPETKLNGILTVFEKGPALLELFGSFNTPSPAIDPKNAYTIWGVSHDGVILSMLECGRKQRKTTYGVSDIDKWNVTFVLTGASVANRYDLVFDKVTVDIDGLREWVGKDGGESSFTEDLTSFDFRYKEPAQIDFKMNESYFGSIFFKNEFWIGLGFKNQAEQKTYLSISSADKVSMNDLIIEARRFRKLVSLFIGQKVSIKRMIFYSSNILAKVMSPSPNFVPPEIPVELFFDDNETNMVLPERSVYFVKFADIEVYFQQIIQKWYAILELGLAPVSDLLLQGITNNNFFDSSDFLKAWQGVEAFHRIIMQDTAALKTEFKIWYKELRLLTKKKPFFDQVNMRMSHAYEPTAKQRLIEVLDQNLATLGLHPETKVSEVWIKEILASRNYLTHLDPESESKKVDMQHLYNYTGLLKALLALMFFRELGITDEILKEVGHHRSFNLRTLSMMPIN